MVADLFVSSFDGGPGCAVRDLLLPHVAAMRGKGMIEGLAIDILRMRGQVAANRRREVGVGAIWHASLTGFCQKRVLFWLRAGCGSLIKVKAW